MNGKKKVEKTSGDEKKTTKKPAKTEELKLGDKAEDPVKEKKDPKPQALTRESVKPSLPPDAGIDSVVKEAATTPANVTLILRSESDVERAREAYDKYRPKKHSGNLAGVRINEKQEPRILWRRA